MSELDDVMKHLSEHLERHKGKSIIPVSRSGLEVVLAAAKERLKEGTPGTRTISKERYDKYVECELILNEMEPLMKRALARPL